MTPPSETAVSTIEPRRPGPILAIETSTTVARVVVVDGASGARLAGAEAAAERHSSNLLRLCVETTEEARVSVAALGAIACGAGPGSFTGLRVGLAVAKGLAMPTDLPLVLVSSLEALAIDMRGAAETGELLLPCLDAGKGQVFAAVFASRADGFVDWVSAPSDELAMLPGHLPGQIPGGPAAALLCAGPGARRFWDLLAEGLGARARFVDVAGPSADAVAALALVKLARGERSDLGRSVPLYGRAPDITQPKRR